MPYNQQNRDLNLFAVQNVCIEINANIQKLSYFWNILSTRKTHNNNGNGSARRIFFTRLFWSHLKMRVHLTARGSHKSLKSQILEWWREFCVLGERAQPSSILALVGSSPAIQERWDLWNLALSGQYAIYHMDLHWTKAGLLTFETTAKKNYTDCSSFYGQM